MAHNLNEYLHYVFVLHLNKLDVLLLGEKLCRVVVDAISDSQCCVDKKHEEKPLVARLLVMKENHMNAS